MTGSVAETIRQGLEEAAAYLRGEGDPANYRVHIPKAPDVKAIRQRLNMTQEQFAFRFGFSIHTLRHWEQGKRAPDGATRAYLIVIDHEPAAVQRALKAA
jgi:putative transcriptional regulator